MTGIFSRKIFFVCFLSICNFPIQFSFADTLSASSDAARQAEIIQRRAQQDMQRQFELDRQSAKAPTHIDVPLPKKNTSQPQQKCWDIDTVDLQGVTVIQRGKISRLERKFSDRCIGAGDIQQLMSELTALYIDKGYITARVYLPQQDLTTKKLLLLVVEGQVQSVHEDNDQHTIFLGTVLPGAEGHPFNLRDLEQALDQINRLASNHATFTLEPGEQPGDSVLVMHNTPTNRWHVNLSYDNRGSESTGQNQIGASMGLDNLLGINDYLSITQRRSQHYSDDYRGSESTSVSYIVPFGYATFILMGATSMYDSPLYAPSGAVLNTHGETNQASARWDLVVYRGQYDQVTFSTQVTGKSTKSYLQDVLLEVSSRRLSTLDLDIQYNTRLGNGMFNASIGYTHGLKWWGALRDDKDASRLMPKAQFSTWRFTSGYYLPFSLAEKAMSLNSQLTAQYAEDRLYGSEQMSIGGMYTVRGLKDQSVAGDRGFYLRNDLSLHHPTEIAGYSATLRPYLGLDVGYVTNVDPDAQGGSMVGGTLGLAVVCGPISFDYFYAHTLQSPGVIEDTHGVNYFSVNVKF